MEVEILRTCPDWLWGPHSFLYNGYDFFPGREKRQDRDANTSTPSSAVVKKSRTIRLFPLRAVQGACTTVHFTFTFTSFLCFKLQAPRSAGKRDCDIWPLGDSDDNWDGNFGNISLQRMLKYSFSLPGTNF